MLRRRDVITRLVAFSSVCALPASAQIVRSQVLVVDSGALFDESAFGRRVQTELNRRREALKLENNRIAAALAEEEQQLTEQRAELSPDAFRPLAEAYDTKVQATRSTQLAKADALDVFEERERQRFFRALDPIYKQILREAGAAVILEKSLVRASVSAIEITDQVIARIDATLGDGR